MEQYTTLLRCAKALLETQATFYGDRPELAAAGEIAASDLEYTKKWNDLEAAVKECEAMPDHGIYYKGDPGLEVSWSFSNPAIITHTTTDVGQVIVSNELISATESANETVQQKP